MVGRPPGDGSIDPGELLRSALEKIVFFECRVAQLEAELLAARQVAERARADAAEARSRETEAASALLAEREVRAAQALQQTDLTERVRLLEAERERLMSGLVERARVGGAPASDGGPAPEDGQADLASFIAELRAEIVALRAEQAGRGGASTPAAATARATPAPHASVGALASAFAAGGRTGLAGADAATLQAYLTSHADKVLYERAMADLARGGTPARLVAIRHLEALGARAAAPLLAAALGHEPEAEVKVALLRALARFAEPFAAPLCLRELADPRPEVRAAALEALATVAEGDAEPHLISALGDRSPVVRRRAAVLLNGVRGEQAEEALLAALRDGDGGVARAAAVALSGRTSERVRRALARREITARLQGREAPAAAPTRTPTVSVAAAAGLAAPRLAARPLGAPASASGARAAVAVLEVAPALDVAPAPAPAPAPAAGSPAEPALEEALALECRGALRGRTAEELAAATGAAPARLEAALEALRGRGVLTLRGSRWCVA